MKACIEGADYFIWIADLPPQIHGMTITNGDGTFSVILNSHDCRDRQLDGYIHEFWHIIRDDFYNDLSIYEVENF